RRATDAGPNDQHRALGWHGEGEDRADACERRLEPVFDAKFRQRVAGMQDRRDHAGAHAVKYSVHRLQIAEIDVEGAERRDDYEIREDKGPTSGPRTPESGTQV